MDVVAAAAVVDDEVVSSGVEMDTAPSARLKFTVPRGHLPASELHPGATRRSLRGTAPRVIVKTKSSGCREAAPRLGIVK
eukprot:1289434-Rhodomonas_salina.1